MIFELIYRNCTFWIACIVCRNCTGFWIHCYLYFVTVCRNCTGCGDCEVCPALALHSAGNQHPNSRHALLYLVGNNWIKKITNIKIDSCPLKKDAANSVKVTWTKSCTWFEKKPANECTIRELFKMFSKGRFNDINNEWCVLAFVFSNFLKILLRESN